LSFVVLEVPTGFAEKSICFFNKEISHSLGDFCIAYIAIAIFACVGLSLCLHIGSLLLYNKKSSFVRSRSVIGGRGGKEGEGRG